MSKAKELISLIEKTKLLPKGTMVMVLGRHEKGDMKYSGKKGKIVDIHKVVGMGDAYKVEFGKDVVDQVDPKLVKQVKENKTNGRNQ